MPRKVKYLVATLPYSNVYFAKAYPLERLESGIASAFTRRRWTGWCSTTRRWRSRRCWPAGTGLRPRRSRHSGAPIRSGPSSVRRRRAERRARSRRAGCFRPRAATESWAALNAITELEAALPTRHLDDGRSVQAASGTHSTCARCRYTFPPRAASSRGWPTNSGMRVDHETYSVPTATPTGRCG